MWATFLFLTTILFFNVCACNSRPYYYPEILEFKTTCDGGIKAKYKHDNDPEVGSLSKLNEERYDGTKPETELVKLDVLEDYVRLASGKSCDFPENIHQVVTCVLPDKTPAPCQATWVLREVLKPTLAPDAPDNRGDFPHLNQDLLGEVPPVP